MRHCARHEPAPHCNVAANAVSFMSTLQDASVNLQVERGAASECAGHCNAAIQHSNTARAFITTSSGDNALQYQASVALLEPLLSALGSASDPRPRRISEMR